jgi:hypothetical protein
VNLDDPMIQIEGDVEISYFESGYDEYEYE